MRPVRYLMALGSASLVGCFSARPSAPDDFLCLAVRNSVEAPIRGGDEAKFIEVVRKEARRYLEQVRLECDRTFSHHYREGFLEGFVDYVEAGGSGMPPYLPPFRYRLTHDRTPEGQAATEEWYAGWRHGAAMARQSGLREANIVPLPGPAVPVNPSAELTTPALPPRPPAAPIPPSDRPGKLPLPHPASPAIVLPPVPSIEVPPAPGAGPGPFPKRVSDPTVDPFEPPWDILPPIDPRSDRAPN